MKKSLKLFLVLSMAFTITLTGCNASADFDPDEQDEKLAEYSNPEKFISVNELDQRMEAGDEFIIFGVIDPTNITAKNIEGATLIWRPDYSGNGSKEAVSKDLNGLMYGQEAIEEILSKAGATTDSEIIVYDANDHHDSAQFAWVVEMLGHENVRILDGGINAWTGASKPTGKATRLADLEVQTEYKAPDYNYGVANADLDMMIEALNNPDEWVVIDTRSIGEVNGEATISGAYGAGGLKGAEHIEWTKALNDENILLTREELEKVYGDLEGKKIITFCQSGIRSAHTYEVLTNALGYENVYNYDGSWIEWSYAASTASEGVVDEDTRQEVLSLTTNWTDNKKAE